MVSIVMAYHNEGQMFLEEAVDSLKSSIDIDYELIIIDDFSDTPLLPIDGAMVIRHNENKGIGAAFDTGVAQSSHDNIILMANDVRFAPNKWASLLKKEIEDNPKSLICTAVLPLSLEYPDITFDVAKKYLRIGLHKGANIKWVMGDDESPHHIIEAEWMPRMVSWCQGPLESYEIPCILGAVYGVNKDWYNYIDGFWGHRFWGTLEPLISLKSWFFGGNCLIAPHIETAHYFKSQGALSHSTLFGYGWHKAHNRLLVCYLLLPEDIKDGLIAWLGHNDYISKAKEVIKSNMDEILAKREEYNKKVVADFWTIKNKFDLIFIDIHENKTTI